jgi:hypothetical protein
VTGFKENKKENGGALIERQKDRAGTIAASVASFRTYDLQLSSWPRPAFLFAASGSFIYHFVSATK